MAKKEKTQQTTRNISFNFQLDEAAKKITSLVSTTTAKGYQNIKLLDLNDGIKVKGKEIINHANNNRAMADLGYTEPEIDTKPIKESGDYKIYGAPFQVVLNNRQHYNNCGVESTLNNLAMAGIIKMKENLKDQKSVEKNFLKSVWILGLVNDDGVIGKLDEDDGGTLPDDYRDILKQFNIDSEAYYTSSKCNGTEFSDLNEFAAKISMGYGAVLGVCSDRLWQEQNSESGEITIDHAVAITGVVYADGVNPLETDVNGNFVNAPVGFYIHDSGAWMSRYISLEEFKYVTLYENHGMKWEDYQKYLDYSEESPMSEEEFKTAYSQAKDEKGNYSYYISDLRTYDSELRTYIGKKPNGIFVTITSEPIKENMFNLNATGDKYDNIIEGNNSDNVIKGMAGNDTIYGNYGDDEIRGGKGNDVIIGNVLSSYDRAFLNNNLNFGLDTKLITSDDSGEKTGRNILYGDAGNDMIIGGDDVDLIYGGKGDDKIYAGSGRNAVYGGAGNDLIVGGFDNDRLFADAGNDTIYGLWDNDTINGGAGNDHIYGGKGDDRIETGKGKDTVYFEGVEHGVDNVTSQGGKTIFKFIDEKYVSINPNTEDKTEAIVSNGAKISDMNIAVQKTATSNYCDFGINYSDDSDSDNDPTDGVVFSSFYNSKTGKAKSLDIIDANNDLYRVTVSKSKKAKVADTSASTKDGHDKVNNILFSDYSKGATITTSTKNDIVTMMKTADISNIKCKSDSVFDSIHYTGGVDKYVSEERNTRYYVDSFDSNTALSIYDNIEAIEKIIIDEDGIPKFDKDFNPATEKIVSTQDKLFLGCKEESLNFFFNVGKDSNGAITTKEDGLFILNSVNEGIIASIVKDDDTAKGYIFMDSFFGYDEDKITTFDKTDNKYNFFGNGQIEEINYNYDKKANSFSKYNNLDIKLASIATSVASWLGGSYNTGNYATAFDAFKDSNLEAEAKTALINCYTSQA